MEKRFLVSLPWFYFGMSAITLLGFQEPMWGLIFLLFGALANVLASFVKRIDNRLSEIEKKIETK